MKEALAIAHDIRDDPIRVTLLTGIASYLTDDLKPQALNEAFVATREIHDETARVNFFAEIVRHLTNDLKSQALKEVLAIERKSIIKMNVLTF